MPIRRRHGRYRVCIARSNGARTLLFPGEEAMRPDAAQLKGVWTTVNGRAMYARVWTGSAPGATPMVLVHGLGVSGRYLLPTAVRLVPFHPVYVPDLPG